MTGNHRDFPGRDPNEPSIHDHGAPYNKDDEGNCDCSSCRYTKYIRRREEAAIDRKEV